MSTRTKADEPQMATPQTPAEADADRAASDAPQPGAAAETEGEPAIASGRDRRAEPRIPVMLEVDYRADETFLFAYITDISAMGIFIRTERPEPPGTRLSLRFSPPRPEGTVIEIGRDEVLRASADEDAQPIECEGEVIWINPTPEDYAALEGTFGEREARNPGMGIRFCDLAPDHAERLLELVRTFAYLDDEQRDDVQ